MKSVASGLAQRYLIAVSIRALSHMRVHEMPCNSIFLRDVHAHLEATRKSSSTST